MAVGKAKPCHVFRGKEGKIRSIEREERFFVLSRTDQVSPPIYFVPPPPGWKTEAAIFT